MSLSKTAFLNYIRQFKFRELFNDMGWNNDRTTQSIVMDNISFSLQAVAEKSGFKILLCIPPADGSIPDYITRKKIESKVTKLFQEHLIIFFDNNKTEQIWQLVVRQTGKPTKVSETRWQVGQDPELLFQRAAGVFFELDEEEHITIIDVTKRMADNFHQNNEKVTKQFYDKFKKEHTSFLAFIKGIDDKVNQDWYASLMLNRLMFCYFIQKKGFLNNDKNYLRTQLKACQEKKGKNKFYSFYRHFLLALFHQGLGAPDHSKELNEEIGKIPYLNGGLFDQHELESIYNHIDIDDSAFENLFDFFDQYEWHLDTRHAASGKDINPDVIGYIFEKYINDRAQMGAYYTKEDITDYISKNCIIPFLFDETKRHYPKGFASDSELWQMVQQSGDHYLYNAVKKGVEYPLPEEIANGVQEISQRTEWNKPAPSDYALPTEIWREVVDRRNRYTEVRTKIGQGEITHINDFITYNLNIRQFAQDVVENTGDPELLRHFYKALHSVTIIDPTCGSGAFLFAAMNILEPLYESCIQRMENFVAESNKGKYKFFEEILEQVKSPEHPNLQYFIYKSIILRNLYGVDIMKEAVEIAKLRLFLKLVATVEADYRKPNLGLEPLPDIDFNIRAGNTLIGFGTAAELNKAFEGVFDFDNDKGKIEEKCEIVAKTFARYKEIQLTYGNDFVDFKKAKEDLNQRLKELNRELNLLLHKQYAAIPYKTWLSSHQPFHWFAEFYEIIHDKGGFDVIIGNPPYVEYSKVSYTLNNYATLKCGNLYVYTIERSESILRNCGRIGMIVQLPIVCTDRMIPIQRLFNNIFSVNYFSTFDDRPGKLFDGLEHIRATIFISDKSNSTDKTKRYTTKYIRWNSEFRDSLFDTITYHPNTFEINGTLLKIGNNIQVEIFKKILRKKRLNIFIAHGKHPTYFHNAPQYWIRATNYVPYFWNEKDGVKPSVQIKNVFSNSKIHSDVINAVLNSNLFYQWFIVLSDCRHLNLREIEIFPIDIDEINQESIVLIEKIIPYLMSDYERNKNRKNTYYKTTGKVEYDEYFPKKSKPILDQIDTVLAGHYGFTAEELDFIINYDIKYRMGKELENEEE